MENGRHETENNPKKKKFEAPSDPFLVAIIYICLALGLLTWVLLLAFGVVITIKIWSL